VTEGREGKGFMGAEPKTRSWPFASPYPPFLGFGPLDVWWRLLFRPRPVIPFRYWPRLAVGLLMSAALTLLTLPERLVLILWMRLRSPALDRRRPGPVIILGYYRSGTTFLQFLMNCDPNLYSPRWSQCFSPQGFWISWTFLRFFLTPFLSESRPQDDLAFGPDVPGEDDFALCNGALASTLVGRHVLPRLRDFYDRFHDLKNLTPAEYDRWRRCQLGFVRKLWMLAGGRRVLLKTPGHTARVEELQRLFAATDGVRFVHISRDPLAVVRSNLGLHRSLNPMCHLQDPISEEEQERRTVAEYLATEQSYLAARAHVTPGRLAEMRMEDLRADPVGELRRVYAELGLPFTEAFVRRLLEYLDTTRDYKPNKHPDWDAEQTRRLKEQLAPLVKQFRHEEPAIPKVVPPRPAHVAPGARRGLLALAVVVAAATGALCLAFAYFCCDQAPKLVWPAGIAIGLTTLHYVRRGTRWLGVCAALLTLFTQFAAGLLTNLLFASVGADLVWTTLQEISSIHVLFWTFMGMATAYRLASRRVIY